MPLLIANLTTSFISFVVLPVPGGPKILWINFSLLFSDLTISLL